ncbi:MAG: hypothetical protein KBT48_05945 [Firmicutes bacterium]|nr:hypothetical protein [Bacillota bacterium]
MRKFIAILTCMILLAGCTGTPLKKQTFTIELGDEVYDNPSVYLKENVNTSGMVVKAKESGIRKENKQFVSGNNDYLMVGTYDFAIETKSGKEIPFKVKIKDTKPPTLENGDREIFVEKGTVINWDAYFKAHDLSGTSYEINPYIDTGNPGSYTVELKVSDRFGNSISKSIVINVQ